MGHTRTGLRYDPLEYVRNAPGVDGALLRTFTFGTAMGTDRALLVSAREDIWREQLPDGSWGRDVRKTAQQLLRLLELGEDPNGPAA